MFCIEIYRVGMKSLAGKEQDLDNLQERIYAGKKTFAFLPLLIGSLFFVWYST
jgi:hypothetical protein